MSRALRYLLRSYALPVVGSSAAVSAVALVLSQGLHLNFADSYYEMLPIFGVIFMSIFGFSLTTAYQQMALTMNCRRRDFFAASQLLFLGCSVVCMLLTALAGVLPELLGMGYAPSELFDTVRPLYAAPGSWPVLFLLYWLLQPVGAALGALYGHHKVWAVSLFVLIMLLCVVAVVLLLFVQDGTLHIGMLPVFVFCGVLAVIAVACEIYYGSANAKAVVR